MMSEDEPVDVNEGFTEALASFGRYIIIESKMADALKRSKVPWRETRKLLKAPMHDMRRVRLAQFITELFESIGIGSLSLSEKSGFQYTFENEQCNIHELYPWAKGTGRMVCHITARALNNFFTKDMGLPCSVEEIKCMNVGDDKCVFKLELQPFALYQILLDEQDEALVRELFKGEVLGKVAKKLRVDEDSLEDMCNILRTYQILDDKNGLTELGSAYADYLETPDRPQEVWFKPPWDVKPKESRTERAVSGAFAEAFETDG